MLDVRGVKLPLKTEGTATEKNATRNSQQTTRMARMVAWARLRCGGGGLKPNNDRCCGWRVALGCLV